MKEKKPLQPRVSPQQKIALVLFGVFLFFVLLEAGLRLGGFVLLSIQEYGNSQSIKQKGTYRILCLGESTTMNKYPLDLEEILNKRNIGVRFSVVDKGKGATDTPTILSHVESYLRKYHPNMVVAMMGINDGGEHIPFEAATTSKGMLFIRSFRTYKLTRLLWLHILTKAKEIGFYKPNKDRRSSGKIQTYLPGGGFKKASAESVLTEDSFKKAIELDPKNDNTYIELGWFYWEQGKFSQAEASFKKAIELNPKNDDAYVELGCFYRDQGKFSQAEDLFKKAIVLNPKNDNAYYELGRRYQNQDKFSQAEDSFRKAIGLDPRNGNAYIKLGWFYWEQGKFSQAEDSFKKAIELNPKIDNAYVELGSFYREQGKFSQAEDSFKKAIELNPENGNTYVALGWFYREQDIFSQAEASFKKAIELDPENENACIKLGWLYWEQGKFSQAEDSFKKALELNPNNDRTIGAMSSLYEEMGKPKLAKEYAKKAYRSELWQYNSVTVNNYRKLKEILDRKGIKLVCAQYPMQKVEPLKEIFEDKEGIIFVDNERIFKEALKKSSYREYFVDMFGGDFGHCTQKGNELLAQNIADVILREVFRKHFGRTNTTC